MMDGPENVFPLDFYVQEPSPHPWRFRPEGYLVVILSDLEEGQRAEAALTTDVLDPHDVKLYAASQILGNFETFQRRRSTSDKVIGAFVDDVEGRELYLEYARQGRSALWIRLPEDSVSKALRALADHNYVHARYYGSDTQTDYLV